MQMFCVYYTEVVIAQCLSSRSQMHIELPYLHVQLKGFKTTLIGLGVDLTTDAVHSF